MAPDVGGQCSNNGGEPNRSPPRARSRFQQGPHNWQQEPTSDPRSSSPPVATAAPQPRWTTANNLRRWRSPSPSLLHSRDGHRDKRDDTRRSRHNGNLAALRDDQDLQEDQIQVPSPMLPFIRGPFPPEAASAPFIQGLRDSPRLRVCFRLGEAINMATEQPPGQADQVLELYARVATSSRDEHGKRQQYTLLDLFHPRWPQIIGEQRHWTAIQ